MHIETVRVAEQRILSGDYRILRFVSEKIAAEVRPGQFVHMRISEGDDLVLRRPFSVFKADKQSLTVLFKIVGKGTELMAGLKPGDRISIMGPLGNGFPMPARGIYPLFVAGGYGSAALYLLAERAAVKGILFVGGETAGDILCADEFERLGWNVRIATENGSAGQKGLVTDILIKSMGIAKRVGREPPAPPDKNGNGGAGTHTPYLGTSQPEIYACGPMGMLKAVSGIAITGGWQAWLSLDRHMGCGIGACLACVQKVKDSEAPRGKPRGIFAEPCEAKNTILAKKGRTKGGWKWARVCTEGPVFECRDIIWE